MIVSLALHFIAAALIVVGPQSSDRSTGLGTGVSSEAVRVSRISTSVRPRAAAAKAIASAPVRTVREVATSVAMPKTGSVTIPRDVRAHAAPAAAIASRAEAHRTRAVVVASSNVAPDEAGERVDAVTLAKAGKNAETGGGATAAPTPAQEKLAVPVVAASPTASAVPETIALTQSRAPLDAPNGGWGQSAKPLVEDDGELAKLRAEAHASGHVSIEVDDRGNATRVTLPASLANDVRAELEREFLAMHYLPAECNGLKCVGTLQITL